MAGSEIGRFHREFSLALYVLAALIAAVEIVRHSARPERLLLGATLALITAIAKHTISALATESGVMK